ncbi:hypothetical protein KQH42_22855 [Streptomyces sp. CHA1]|uniref:hypothetical protein n=1 Tax=Streptomyces TaxID=1883 RepID=UPI0003C2D15A|nr:MULTISPECIES: hypothetical protein [Streptomyces]QPA01632.1 hypothetical protein DI273_24180 [Streptomyces violascens]UYM23604.1 hypothetical protein NQP46_08175 [Streptomyces albus]ESP97261.1 hypothetical protein B591_23261 [Streptomyces sp. GBA 94-10 4N24]ESQ03419.1 hypothetical protein B590_23072 [Streptomyces sp. PVA_94-07]MBP3080158.1 hypothetical protein [Streptomyces sp. 604F]
MLYTKKLIGLAALGVLLVGCGSSDPDSAGAAEGAPAKGAAQESPAAEQKVLPVALDGSRPKVHERGAEELKVTPKPGNSAPFAERVEHKLRETVLGTAKVPGRTSAKCADGVTLKAGAVSSCEATYEGATIPYEVKISDSYKEGSFLTMYNTKAEKGLLVAETVYEEFWQQFGGPESAYPEASKLACDELPAAEAVEVDADTGHRCQLWNEHGNQGKGGYETYEVRIGGFGPSFRPAS